MNIRKHHILPTSLLAMVLFCVSGCDRGRPAERPNELNVYMTNQSSADPVVDFQVFLDGSKIFQLDMEELGGHSVEQVITNITSGMHTLSVRSTSVQAATTIEFTAEPTNWYVISYWHNKPETYGRQCPSKFVIEHHKSEFKMD